MARAVPFSNLITPIVPTLARGLLPPYPVLAPLGDEALNPAMGRVLIVDADPAGAVLAVILGRVFAITTCPTASDALAQMMAVPPDLVVCDAVLADLDAVSFLRSLRAKVACPVVVVTAVRDTSIIRELSAVGIEGFFDKPPRLDRLLSHIYALCSVSSRPPRSRVSRALEHIASRYREPLTLTSVARAVAVSPTHLAHAFKADMQTTLMSFLTRIRVEIARRMLVETDATLSQIAIAAGFADAPACPGPFAGTWASRRAGIAAGRGARPLAEAGVALHLTRLRRNLAPSGKGRREPFPMTLRNYSRGSDSASACLERLWKDCPKDWPAFRSGREADHPDLHLNLPRVLPAADHARNRRYSASNGEQFVRYVRQSRPVWHRNCDHANDRSAMTKSTHRRGPNPDDIPLHPPWCPC